MSSLLIIQDRFISYRLLIYSIRIDKALLYIVYHPLVRMLPKSCVDRNYCATCVFFDNAFGRSCIRIVNKIGEIIDPCCMPISIFFIDVFPARVQIHRSDKKFLM